MTQVQDNSQNQPTALKDFLEKSANSSKRFFFFCIWKVACNRDLPNGPPKKIRKNPQKKTINKKILYHTRTGREKKINTFTGSKNLSELLDNFLKSSKSSERFECVMSHIVKSHLKMSHIVMSHVTHCQVTLKNESYCNESCHTLSSHT